MMKFGRSAGGIPGIPGEDSEGRYSARMNDPAATGPERIDDGYPVPLEGRLRGDGVRVAVVAARFNDLLVDHMLRAAVSAWRQMGGSDDRLTIARVPGSFELPVTAKKLAETGDYAAVVCLGCVIRGETDHYDHVVEQTARGVQEVGTSTGVPCIFGVLTCDTLEQAVNRAGTKMGNAGRSAMLTAVEMADLMTRLC